MALADMSSAYIHQYLLTATKGNVVCYFAVLTNRAQFKCVVCEMTLTTNRPNGTEIDYQIQEFVKIHAHVGGHKDPVCTCGGHLGMGVGHSGLCPLFAPPPTPVTADFKKIPIGSGIHADLKWEKSEQIANQLQKYDEEMNQKNIAKKVAELQAAPVGTEGVIPLQMTAIQEPPTTEQETVEYQTVEYQKLLNVLMIQELKAKAQAAIGAGSGRHSDPPPQPTGTRAKKLKQPTGRKFR